jgi:hypothetical protein
VSDRRFGPILSLVRQGLTVGVDFGAHSLEALLWVAETVEESVYRSGSLLRVPRGVAFVLDNPPLRAGSFKSARLTVDGTPIPAECVRVHAGTGSAWRSLSEVSQAAPLELVPGCPTDIEVECDIPAERERLRVRLELRPVAIPPLVWFEFSDALRPGGRV